MTDRSDRAEGAVALLVHYSGDVQGVGFRATAAALARDYPVTGWVRNLSDGRVQLLAEGPEESVRAFLDAIRSRFRGNIEDEQAEWRDFSGRYTRFDIARSPRP
jgi:acylphosphatase